MITNIHTFLDTVLGTPENELVEFKTADLDYNTDKIYRYVSALANEANLKSHDAWYLILWVEPKKHLPVGTTYREDHKNLQSLKQQVYQTTKHSIQIYSEVYQWYRIIILEIPSAPRWIPISVNGHYYAREDENLVALSDSKRDEIRNQKIQSDCSAQIILDATIDDLDPVAIRKTRENYITKNSNNLALIAEARDWTNIELLNRIGITIWGKITSTAILLLGKKESASLVSPADLRITWILKDAQGIEKGYEHFYPPFLLAVDSIFAKVRNLRYRYMQEWTLFPEEVDMYDSWVFRELLHNAIAHQDYTLDSRISLVEFEDGRLIFENAWVFLPGSIDQLIESDTPPSCYRNSFLAKAMVEVNMIDTIWSGIKRVFQEQRKRFFPMPTYSFPDTRVRVELFGKILDIKYANLLAKNTDLTLTEIIALDKIQKNKVQELDKNGVLLLKKKGLVEWTYPKVYIGAEVARLVWKTEEYIKNRAMKDDFYKQKIEEYISENGSINKSSLRELLLDMLPKVLSEKQKEAKINNLIQSMKLPPYELIITGSRKMAKWIKSNNKR
jgi:ATP-dependent DNA helicase RecG